MNWKEIGMEQTRGRIGQCFSAGIGIVICAMYLVVSCMAPSKATMAEPNSYVCHRAKKAVQIDGKLDDAVWRDAAWTKAFVDIEGSVKPKPPLRKSASRNVPRANVKSAKDV